MCCISRVPVGLPFETQFKTGPTPFGGGGTAFVYLVRLKTHQPQLQHERQKTTPTAPTTLTLTTTTTSTSPKTIATAATELAAGLRRNPQPITGPEPIIPPGTLDNLCRNGCAFLSEPGFRLFQGSQKETHLLSFCLGGGAVAGGPAYLKTNPDHVRES